MYLKFILSKMVIKNYFDNIIFVFMTSAKNLVSTVDA